MSNTEELYLEVILDHNRRPRHFAALANATHHTKGFNPLCGDHYHEYLNLSPEGRIQDVGFTGAGCVISRASHSIMTEALQDKTPQKPGIFSANSTTSSPENPLKPLPPLSASSPSSPASPASPHVSNAPSWAGMP